MKGTDVFNEFLKLDDIERTRFFNTLMLWSDLHMPDNEFMVITKQQYRHATQGMIPDMPALYEVAKQVCHNLGLPYHHPITRERIEPPKQNGERRRAQRT